MRMNWPPLWPKRKQFTNKIKPPRITMHNNLRFICNCGADTSPRERETTKPHGRMKRLILWVQRHGTHTRNIDPNAYFYLPILQWSLALITIYLKLLFCQAVSWACSSLSLLCSNRTHPGTWLAIFCSISEIFSYCAILFRLSTVSASACASCMCVVLFVIFSFFFVSIIFFSFRFPESHVYAFAVTFNWNRKFFFTIGIY